MGSDVNGWGGGGVGGAGEIAQSLRVLSPLPRTQVQVLAPTHQLTTMLGSGTPSSMHRHAGKTLVHM